MCVQFDPGHYRVEHQHRMQANSINRAFASDSSGVMFENFFNSALSPLKLSEL